MPELVSVLYSIWLNVKGDKDLIPCESVLKDSELIMNFIKVRRNGSIVDIQVALRFIVELAKYISSSQYKIIALETLKSQIKGLLDYYDTYKQDYYKKVLNVRKDRQILSFLVDIVKEGLKDYGITPKSKHFQNIIDIVEVFKTIPNQDRHLSADYITNIIIYVRQYNKNYKVIDVLKFLPTLFEWGECNNCPMSNIKNVRKNFNGILQVFNKMSSSLSEQFIGDGFYDFAKELIDIIKPVLNQEKEFFEQNKKECNSIIYTSIENFALDLMSGMRVSFIPVTSTTKVKLSQETRKEMFNKALQIVSRMANAWIKQPFVRRKIDTSGDFVFEKYIVDKEGNKSQVSFIKFLEYTKSIVYNNRTLDFNAILQIIDTELVKCFDFQSIKTKK